MKISEIITDKYKLRMPPTVYYELLADVVEAEEEQEPTTGRWKPNFRYGMDPGEEHFICSECNGQNMRQSKYCPDCGCQMKGEDK